MEEVVMSHPHIGEAIVIGIKDDLKGEVPIAFATLKNDSKISAETLEKEIVHLIRQKIGPVASFKTCVLVSKLPKTRSGKYLRHIIRKICQGEEFKLPPTIEDLSAIDVIKESVLKRKILDGTKISFGRDD
jgi:propionyl-CoA synthetase